VSDMGGNSTSNRPHILEADLFDDYDRLPRLVRAALQEAVVNWGTGTMLRAYRMFAREYNRAQAEDLLLRILDENEADEIKEFAKANGGYSAHLAAGASILRCGAC
jgi:hypothetical protein